MQLTYYVEDCQSSTVFGRQPLGIPFDLMVPKLEVFWCALWVSAQPH